MKKFSLLCLLSSSLLMGGCTYLKDQFGLTHRTPDEFSVVKRAPLAIPPDLNEVSSLPAPQPGMQRPQEVSPQQSAQEAILKGPAATDTSGPSASENSLLAKAGATQDTTNIRETVDREAKENADKNRPVVKKNHEYR